MAPGLVECVLSWSSKKIPSTVLNLSARKRAISSRSAPGGLQGRTLSLDRLVRPGSHVQVQWPGSALDGRVSLEGRVVLLEAHKSHS